MRATLTIIATLLMLCHLHAQDSTTVVPLVAQPSFKIGTSLVTAGSMLTFVPQLHSFCVDLRTTLQSDNHPRLTFDNYLQYAPIAMPFALKTFGLKGRSSFRHTLGVTALSVGSGALVLNLTKYFAHVQRPDHTSFNSFPSGHTFTAVLGAELLRKEYGDDYPLLATAVYGITATVAFMRLYNNRHWLADLLGGAGIAILSVDLSYWVADKLVLSYENHHSKKNAQFSLSDAPILLTY
ncbi:MAG: phosphatase PAP2 family protein [Bacteroidales bacterium]|nr:phosphatase PAP2 family protein [Bacteroidales bacterium]